MEYGINNLINTPLWNLIQQKLNSANLEWKDALVGDQKGVSKFRKSKVSFLDDEYLRRQLAYSVNLYNKQHWNYDLDGSD